MATKIILALSLIGFWLFLPVGLMAMGVGGFNEVDTRDLETLEAPTSITALTSLGDYVLVYFKLMFFIIPGASPILLRFVNFLQILTVLFVLVMVRGN